MVNVFGYTHLPLIAPKSIPPSEWQCCTVTNYDTPVMVQAAWVNDSPCEGWVPLTPAVAGKMSPLGRTPLRKVLRSIQIGVSSRRWKLS